MAKANLFCPDCMGDGGDCERCNGKGTIRVEIPDSGVSDYAKNLVVPDRKPNLVPGFLIAAACIAAACYGVFAYVIK